MFEKRLWFASHPFTESHLMLAPATDGEQTVQYQINFFDPDGREINEVTIAVEPKSSSCLELDPFLGGLPYESGFRHGILRVTTNVEGGVWIRLVNNEQVSILGELSKVRGDAAGFFPVHLVEGRSHLLLAVNLSNNPATVRSRLFLGNRSPDTALVIPPNGIRSIPIERAYADAIESLSGGSGYIRAAVKAGSDVGMLMVESSSFGEDQESTFVWGAM